jgi:hypothetical protein
VTEHHGRAEDHRSRVGLVGVHDVLGNVTASRLEEGVVAADVAAGDDARAADERSADVRHDRAVQVRHDHNVELLRLRDELHRRVVDDHVVRGDARRLVLLRNAAERVQEEAVAELHDVRLVNARHLLAVVLEREAADALGLGAGRDLKTFDDTREALVLEARVLTLRVLTDDGEVNVVVPGREAREGFAKHDRCVDVELLAHGDVPRRVAGLNGGEKNT